MSKMPTKRTLKIFAAVAAGVSTLIYAVAVFLPNTQPTVLLGQYALQERDLYNSTGTIAYRPWFENGAWQGDVIEYFITSSGIRQTDVPVGDNPATAGTAGGCLRTAPSGCWSARATFIANGADSPTGTYWTSRNIFTNNNGQVNFGWDQLNPLQRAGLDSQTVSDAILTPSLNSDPFASPILNYIRGERLNERANNAATNSTGDLRTRYSVLGDITSTPVYIGPPKDLLGRVSGYNTFASTYASRAGRVAVGANDGMLHVFDEADGSEVYAYVPSMVIDKLKLLASRDAPYTHVYYVDGELTTGSAQIQTAWKTLLTGGGGAGFAGLYALDVTDPAYTSSKLLFEKSGGSWGHVYGRPRIAPVGGTNAVPNWYIFAGNGYSTNASHPTSLMMIDLDDFGVDSQDFSVTEIAISDNSGPITGGLSAPVLLSTDDDDMVELAFAGDINGDLYMFVIDQSNPANTQAILVYDGSPDQPITNAPAVSEHPTRPGYMVYFGTGSIFSLADALDDGESTPPGNYSKKQAVHGIWVDTSDINTLQLNLPYDSSDLQTQTLSEVQNYTFGSTVETVRIVPSENAVAYGCPLSTPSCTTHKGWKVSLPNCGERLVGAPFIRAGRVQFVTHNPTGLNCGTTQTRGDSWVMSLDFLTGGDGNDIVYNLNSDTTLDNNDAVLLSGIYKPPVGLHLGPGNISQPSFARLKLGIDKMFINGILLPLPNIPPPGPLFGGHIDVTVDSPFGGEMSPNNVSKHSEGYNITTHDGLGRAVDGHVHDYDTIHDVQYVDLFELEPRRGKANLATALAPVTGPCSTSVGSKQLTVTIPDPNAPASSNQTIDKCIEAIEGELNRVYDTLHTDADGVYEGSKGSVYQSEVNPTSNGIVYSGYVDGFNATTPADF
ncbi:MAG TPA: PilC/PilY family type IV pilus protein, partial [Gammaproteobacteria bacterium]|nr:PilC/PilY family type IV pilus protein [Gammaproteobacteria bacterium]